MLEERCSPFLKLCCMTFAGWLGVGVAVSAAGEPSIPSIARSVAAEHKEGRLLTALRRAETLREALAREVITQAIQELWQEPPRSRGPYFKHKAYERIRLVDRGLAIRVLTDSGRSLRHQPIRSEKTIVVSVMMGLCDLRTTAYFDSLLDDPDFWRMSVTALQFLAGENFGLKTGASTPEDDERTREKARAWALRYLAQAEGAFRGAENGIEPLLGPKLSVEEADSTDAADGP
jgi:hypothetical protein